LIYEAGIDMNKQICQCGHEFSSDEHNHCPACGSLPGEGSDYVGSCEYKLNSRGSSAIIAQDDGEGSRTSLAETNAVKKTEAEIRKLKT
jgi:hypothetical protein